MGLLQLLPGLLVPVAVYSVLALARRYSPPAKLNTNKDLAPAVLEERFQVTQWFVNSGTVLVMVLVFWVGYESLSNLNRWVASSEGASYFQLLPTRVIWGFFPGFAAVALSWDLVLLIWSACGGRAVVARYKYWTDLKAGFNSGRVLHLLVLFIVLPIGFVTAFAVPMYTTLREHEIDIRGFGSLKSHHYLYSEAKRMAVCAGFRDRDGKLSKRAGILIIFADGRRWSSADNRDFEPTVDQNLLKFLEKKTGIEVEYVQAEADFR